MASRISSASSISASVVTAKLVPRAAAGLNGLDDRGMGVAQHQWPERHAEVDEAPARRGFQARALRSAREKRIAAHRRGRRARGC